MNDLIASSGTIGVFISLSAYGLGVLLKKKTGKSIFNPLLISIALVIVLLLVLNIDYESYNNSARYLTYFLTPATVSLAIPLYKQIMLLKKHLREIICGVLAGVLSSLCSVWVMSMLFGLTHEYYVTLLPKSITTAIGMGVAQELGGITNVAVAVIVITGVQGNIIAEMICKLFRIKHPISRGLAIGTASHAVGTAKALEIGEIEGAMSSLAIVVAGLITVVGASVFAMFL